MGTKSRIIFYLSFLFTTPLVSQAAEISGYARVTDGDTIRIGDSRIRLWGIDAPESKQTCEGRNGEIYECGRDATAVMNELTRDKIVTCTPVDKDIYGRIVAICKTETSELNAAMVARGWAIDYTHYSHSHYRNEQEKAKQGRLGIWSGRFEMPADFRRDHRQ